jgi:hypothetical protein
MIINFTPAQAEWITWCLDAMHDFASDDDCHYNEPDVPDDPLDRPPYTWEVPTNQDVIEDLLYRLEDQIPDMIRGGVTQLGEGSMSQATAALNAAYRIRKALGIELKNDDSKDAYTFRVKGR